MIHARLPLMAAALSIAAVISGPARAADPTGLWLSGDGDVKMRIAHCGANICSTIAWLKEPNENGKPKVDKYNADESKRGRPVMGSQIILGMAPDGADKWSGKVYNAEAYNACTNMPRFGHKGILTEQQIKDVVALLMDPDSPVNK